MYADAEIVEKFKAVHAARPDLYISLHAVLSLIRAMDYDMFCEWIKEKESYSDARKEIKRVGDRYELRLPPKSKTGVLRMFFEVESDCYSIRITDLLFKDYRKKGDN